MYPRNAASPEPIAIGAVVQISNGAVQTSGVTVRIKPIGVAEDDGGGTTAYSTDGIVLYTPTQAETNYTSFVLIAKKTGCIPVAVTVVTTASATPGYAGLDWSKIAAPTTTVDLSGTTIKTATDITTLIGVAGAGLTALGDTRLANLDITISSRLAASSITLSGGAVTVGTNNDKTGYSISGTLTTLDAIWSKIQKWLRLGFRKDAAVTTDHATELSEINANGGSGAGAYNNTTDALEAIRDRGDVAWITGSSGTGAGARTIVITVNDGTDPLENARVRLTQGAETYIGDTNVSGQVTFNVDDATWTVAITKAGYTFAGTTLLVNGDETATYSMTQVAITPPSSELQCNGYLYAYDEMGSLESGVDVYVQMKTPPPEAVAGDSKVATFTSGVDGLVLIENLFRNAVYYLWREGGNRIIFEVPDGEPDELVELPPLVGDDVADTCSS